MTPKTDPALIAALLGQAPTLLEERAAFEGVACAKFVCRDCGCGFDALPSRCHKCGGGCFDPTEAYTAPADLDAALKARAIRAIAEDAELKQAKKRKVKP